LRFLRNFFYCTFRTLLFSACYRLIPLHGVLFAREPAFDDFSLLISKFVFIHVHSRPNGFWLWLCYAVPPWGVLRIDGCAIASYRAAKACPVASCNAKGWPFDTR